MKKFIWLLSLALIVCCSKNNGNQEDPKPEPQPEPQPELTAYEQSIESVSVSPTDNVLRFNVVINKKKECSTVVEVRKVGEESWQKMPGEMALLLYPNTEYECRVGVENSYGDPVSFTTGALPEGVPTVEMTLDEGGPESGYIVQHKESEPGYITVSDVRGKVMWYERFDEAIRCVDYDLETGRFAFLLGTYLFPNDKNTPKAGKQIVVIGLDGKRITTIDVSDETVRYPHHEIKLLPGGNMLTLDHNSRVYDLTSVDKPADSEVWSDILVEIDPTGKPVWKWNIFDNVDIVAYWPRLKEYRPKMGIMKDFVHTNSLSKDSEGNYYASLFYPEEIWKIDGKTGEILYRYGPLGDVTVEGGFPLGGYHSIVMLAPDKFLLHKNPRKLTEPCEAQIVQVDPVNKTAVRLMKVADDVAYASTSSSNVELLPDGQTLLFNSTEANVLVFTDLEGKSLRVMKRGYTCYRAFYFEKMF